MKFLTKESDLIIDQGQCILYFYASWLISHDKMLSLLKEINAVAIDVDYFKSLCVRFKIKSIPTLLSFFAGKEQYRIVGENISKDDISKLTGDNNAKSKK